MMREADDARRARDRAEHEDAQRIVEWLRRRSRERMSTDPVSGATLAIVANKIEENFLPPR